MGPIDLAACIDHTLLKPEAQALEIEQEIREAVEFRFATVCVAPVWVRHVAGKLAGSGVRTASVVGFPHGNQKGIIKSIEATSALKDGAEEVDVVANLAHLLRLDLDAARGELLEIAKAARANRRDAVIKVIVESALLLGGRSADQGEAIIECACRAVRESGCDYIKTSTGFHPAGGASIEAVRLMKKHGTGIRIKASGGIRDLPTALAMIEAGADRLGTSASVAIIGAWAASDQKSALI